jgi:hypothetical protein
MAVSTKRKNSLKSKSNSKTRKQFKKFRKTKKNVRKMKGGVRLNVYSFKVIEDVEERRATPIFGHCIVYAANKEKARTFIKDIPEFLLEGNIRGVETYDEGYENGYITIILNTVYGVDTSIKFFRNIKKIGTAPEGASEGIVDLDARAIEEPHVNLSFMNNK